jgi:hypothetical protein
VLLHAFIASILPAVIHRIRRIQFILNNHIVHHSSEEFNLACALRQSYISLLHCKNTLIFLKNSLLHLIQLFASLNHIQITKWISRNYCNTFLIVFTMLLTVSADKNIRRYLLSDKLELRKKYCTEPVQQYPACTYRNPIINLAPLADKRRLGYKKMKY